MAQTEVEAKVGSERNRWRMLVHKMMAEAGIVGMGALSRGADERISGSKVEQATIDGVASKTRKDKAEVM